MKIRTGFVSNSSSASYIIAFDRKPNTVGELWDVMFPDGATRVKEFGRTVSTIDLATHMFERIHSQKRSATIKSMLGYAYGMHHDWRIDGPREEDYATTAEFEEARRAFWDKRHKEERREEKKSVDKFRKENKGKFIVCCTFSDHDSIEIFLHNGEGLDHLPHIFISKH